MFVAVDSDEVVGWCETYLRAGAAPSGLVWLAVRRDRRGEGIGAELFRAGAAHLRSAGASALDSYSATPEGRCFLERRGFVPRAESEISVVEPRRPETAAAQVDVVPLAAVLDRVPELFTLHTGGLGEVFGPELADQQIAEWSARTLDDPDLSAAGSKVALVESKVAALAFLTVTGNRASNEMTATLPELRGRGLARTAKLATLDWAATNGIDAVYTANYADNAPMLTVNRALGYRRIATSVDFRAPASA